MWITPLKRVSVAVTSVCFSQITQLLFGRSRSGGEWRSLIRLGVRAHPDVSPESRNSCDDVSLQQREVSDMPADPKVNWEKSPEDLVELFSVLAPKDAGVEQKKMFGWPCCFVNGNLFAGSTSKA